MTTKDKLKRSLRFIGIDTLRLRKAFRRQVHRIRHRGGARAEWYDHIYGTSEMYQLHYTDSRYLPIWEAICARIDNGATVVEIGCGSGQLAEMLEERRRVAYTGFDFSNQAIAIAKSKGIAGSVEVADARTTPLLLRPADFVICTEVLEHIQDDLTVLQRVPSGRRVIATVPDFESETHVRWFDSEAAVVQRYGHLFENLTVSTMTLPGVNGRFFLMDGHRPAF